MNLSYKIDAFDVLKTTKPFLEDPKYVFVDFNSLNRLIQKVSERINKGLPEREEEFFTLGDYEKDVQIVFLENVVNFCFWSEKGKEKWKVEFDGQEDDGSSALRIVFERALKENIAILDADYLKNLSMGQLKEIFRPSNGIEITLIEKRLESLKEAGRVLSENFKGKFANLLSDSNYDAVEIVKNIVQNFNSFNDSYKGVNFYKRAQLNTFDIAQIPSEKIISNIDSLTAMADYKLPQLLRFIGVLKYSDELAAKVDGCELIELGSREEMEIRSSTIWAVHLVAQNLNISAGLADRAIWWLSRELDIDQLYHRTYTIYY